eukprot:CAMPEP_0113939708 /NCGR_PEP_ID=MMETSP1339-20121228/5988_1 /TAXON_ID=94617 /ORGANISM="Fibrocapsa japonica" /LENGTH=71 /DNA_ID=CAMNT_0000943305 /DNA_START=78 /DNA_END=293 /DNA_ORIENTATION=+ /assembly_acc=CAM_ASM_000762
MTFGGGVSMCPGRHLANVEIKIFVATVLTELNMKITGDLSKFPKVDGTRAGLGIMPPQNDIQFQWALEYEE